MLHPSQFEVSEAWISFQLNSAPVKTNADGDFNCIALMDAASCYIFGSEFIPVDVAEPTRAQFRNLLQGAQRQGKLMPKTLLVAREDVVIQVRLEAVAQGIEVVDVPESELLVFIGGARASFAEQFGSAGG